ncbi:hypothetical protein F383_07742 [Gossypium arboreum]|uniref:Uncharacterized protein n=1 Tax=Gossypium arboreum TaxID=29729 RepID=A0A0B0NJH3_GOSAR|nr:hypothetical protein F383_07742 [Gossypium arboreum]
MGVFHLHQHFSENDHGKWAAKSWVCKTIGWQVSSACGVMVTRTQGGLQGKGITEASATC